LTGSARAYLPPVSASRVGERVWLFESQFGRPFGTAAEFTVQPSGHAVAMPDSISFEQGACLGVPAMTAHRCLFADGPLQGKTVLIPGGAGAVGHYAVQEAKLAGAVVISTVSSDHKAAIATAAGADHIINYRTEDVVARIMDITGGEGVDHIAEVDFAGNFPVTSQVLKTNGVAAIYSWGVIQQPPVPLQFRNSNTLVRNVLVYEMPEPAKQAAIADITAWLESGALVHQVGPHFPLEETVAAHLAVEGGAIGNVIVDVGNV